ncbi:hypothetical protein AMJ52_01180 [candidate division TA06 bacterium DG_78]|uniref:Uncharacterized protein n=1 Tax=candidate division TA06 bacterium DG_78 TaxID=1703772 RepID=A0A0S7YHT6_UNCT6|nr:MAG: hypothetical protein AMJ52_01180 [candidate division TA06 bacterium DG_78]
MKRIKYIPFIIAIVGMICAIVVRIFLPGKVLFGLAALTYLRITISMLLFAITFHLLFPEK